MIEFSDDLSTIYQDKRAVFQRVATRLRHTTSCIPYYDRGVDVSVFSYGDQSSAIRMALRDFGVNVKVDHENRRVQVYDVMINENDFGGY